MVSLSVFLPSQSDMPPKKAAAKKGQAKKKGGGGGGLQKKVKVDDALFAIINVRNTTRAQIVKKMWVYIKKHNLQDPNNGRFIYPDQKFARVMGKRGQRINAFKMATYINKHVSG